VGTERDARFPGERSSLEQRHWNKSYTRHRCDNRGEMTARIDDRRGFTATGGLP
jgi:hypothetical protein